MNKKNITRVILICVAMCMIISCFGCSMVTVNEERQKTQTVAVVNGTELTYSDYQDQLNQDLSYQYGYTYDQYLGLDDEIKTNIQNSTMKNIVDTELEYQDAIKEGYALTDEQTEELKKSFNDEIDYLGPNYRNLLEAGGKYTEEEMDKMVDEYVTMQLGEDFDWDKRFAKICKEEVVGNYEADLTKSVTVSDKEIQDYYDLNVSNQQNMLKPSDDKTESSYALLETFGQEVYVYPDDVRRVQHLLIGIDEETRNKIISLRASGDTAEADKLRDESLAELKDKAEEVYGKVTSEKNMTAEKFAEYMEEYGTDQSAVYGEYRLEGYLVHSYSSTSNYPQEMIDAALAMTEVGEISEMFESDYGWEILRLVSFPDPVIPLEEKYDSIKETLTNQKNTQTLSEKRTELEEAADITYYYDRVKV